MAKGWSFGSLTAALKDAAFKATGKTSGTVAAGQKPEPCQQEQPEGMQEPFPEPELGQVPWQPAFWIWISSPASWLLCAAFSWQA